MRILLPSSLSWDLDRFDGVDVEIYDPKQEIPAHLRGAEAIVLWANPPWQRSHVAEVLPNLQWVQGLAAGADEVLSASFPDDVILASGRGLHDRPAAEHALALILASARRLHVLRDAQGRHEWRFDLGGYRSTPRAERSEVYWTHGSRSGVSAVSRRHSPRSCRRWVRT
ncbi:MAG: hypothetical protein U5K81_11680 [Trueperaceae bacterium]|nr:hypothetical protein [Trueperaceae bacterium]